MGGGGGPIAPPPPPRIRHWTASLIGHVHGPSFPVAGTLTNTIAKIRPCLHHQEHLRSKNAFHPNLTPVHHALKLDYNTSTDDHSFHRLTHMPYTTARAYKL